MNRPLSLAVSLAAVFAVTVGIMWAVMPYPRRNIDYMVIGGTATMVSMAVLFLVLINTHFKGHDIFFKRRK